MSDGSRPPTIDALHRWMTGGALSRAEMEELFGRLMDGELAEPLQAALLVALAMKGESVAELAGAAAAMRRRVRAIPHARDGVLDTCGTGGDGKGTFNISTAAALVAAAAGAPVAKHGNRSVSSRSGSADVLTALGVQVEVEPAAAGRSLDEIGIAFLFAPRLHPAMRQVMPVRQALGVRTTFNLLGPLTNPAGATRQLLGVYAADRVEVMAGVLAELGTEHALVVHGSDGLDEITLSGPTRVAQVLDGRVTLSEVTPEDFGFERCAVEALAGGTPERNAELMQGLLAGRPGALRDVTLINAGAALVVAGLAADWRQGVERARGAIDTGAAAAKLEALRQRHGP
jgi:anthranilate phosphoribosyltransferase